MLTLTVTERCADQYFPADMRQVMADKKAKDNAIQYQYFLQKYFTPLIYKGAQSTSTSLPVRVNAVTATMVISHWAVLVFVSASAR